MDLRHSPYPTGSRTSNPWTKDYNVSTNSQGLSRYQGLQTLYRAAAMAPHLPRPPTCERRPDVDPCLLDNATTFTSMFDNYHSADNVLGRHISLDDDPSTMLADYSDPSKHNITPCCTQPFCDFELHPTIDPSLTSGVCMDASACFDFACLDDSCLEYANTPCQEPGCAEPAAMECTDPHCEDSTECLECLDDPAQDCTTCCMSDICPNPAHGHLPKHAHPIPAGYVPWHAQHPHCADHNYTSICSSARSSVEPRLSAALQSSTLSYTSSPATDARSTPARFEHITLDTPAPRGGHRRLQGAPAKQKDGAYTCHWIVHSLSNVICGHSFGDAKGLHEHIQSSHFAGSASNHPCHWHGCDSGTFNTKPKLARHLHSHTEYKPHKCDFDGCDLSFVTQQQRDVHRKKHTGEKPFACKECGKAFAYMDLLKSHMRSGVHGQADKKFACVICGEGFSDSSNRTKHTKSVHDPVTGVPCPEPGCGYVDTRREKLRTHCEVNGHALALITNPRDWEDFFNHEQSLRRPHKGHKKKRSAHQAGFELL